MKSKISILILFALLLSCGESQPPRVLVFSKTKGYRHKSIEVGKIALMDLGKNNGFLVDTTEDASLFDEENLKRYKTVIFLNTTQDVLDVVQQNDFKRFIEAGGGFVGIHAAADTEYEWPWYGKLVGAYFKSHPQIQDAKVKKVRPFGPNTLPDNWARKDEWYNYKNISDQINVIYTLDESTYEGGENGNTHPIAWYHEFEGGRAFYTGMGHTEESYADSLYLDHVLQGIKYAMGESTKLKYAKAKTKRAVDDTRFAKTVLDFNLNEPTEMAILPDDRILFVERKGDVKLFDPKTNKTSVINTFNVNTTFEDGMIGIALDPGFIKNHFLYIFYSHPKRSANILSRFVFSGDKIDMASEKEMLEVITQRDKCCHTAGSLLFGPDKNLYISTGDNTSPFESNGFSPSDESEGRSPFDAQKSSANTNDLRGKILRIHPEPDGSYTIPEGNLFPKGEEKTRPEIYIMGCRNPYRISIDEKTGFLYWGEVGPDAGEDDNLRGPRGYDEVNQAKKAGNYGWPHFVGNNYAYAKYDFANKKHGEKWNAEKPLNTSPNNTGKQELPSANPAFIWYPYVKSPEFPMLKEGGRNAMAGPIYYSENYDGIKTAYPDYFDGKLMIYDWIRNWIFLVTMDESGNMKDIEPFMANTKFNNIIDMAVGNDGRIYMIEYGSRWFNQNLDARLIRIDYNGGNRTPVAVLNADKLTGAVPLEVTFTSEGSKDYDKEAISYQLETAGKTLTSADGKFKFTFDQPGAYDAILTVKDVSGATAKAQTQIVAGNEPPVVNTTISSGNSMFYFPEQPVRYNVTVTDKEDGSTQNGKIKASQVKVTFNFVKGYDMAQVAQGHQQSAIELPGKLLMDKSDCKSCHMVDQRSAGPSFKEVASKYIEQTNAVEYLAAKIIKGGAGVWGTTEMAAHPQISVDDAKKMVDYVLSLSEKKAVDQLPLAGTAKPEDKKDGAYLLTASYTDQSVNGLPSLTSSHSAVLGAPVLNASKATKLEKMGRGTYNRRPNLDRIKHGASALFENIDMTNVHTLMPVVLKYGDVADATLEIRLNGPDGELLGKTDFKDAAQENPTTDVLKMTGKIKIRPLNGRHTLCLVFKNEQAGDKNLYQFVQMYLSNK